MLVSNKKIGKDICFVKDKDLPFRLIEIPTGSASLPPSPRNGIPNKRHARPIPLACVEEYGAPPSLIPPPIIPNRNEEPTPIYISKI